MGKGSRPAPPIAPDSVRHRAGSIIRPETPEIEQNYPSEVTAVVWTGGKGVGAFSHPGHAAMCLRRNMQERVDFDDLVNNRYVSYIPGGDYNDNDVRSGLFQESYAEDMEFEIAERTNERLGARVFPPSQRQQVIKNYGRDDAGSFRKAGEQAFEEQWGIKADTFVSMAALTDDRIGLDYNRIVSWCLNFKSAPDFYYDFVSNSNNCASVVWKALDMGGGKAFCAIHTSVPNNRIYITPKEFADYSEFIRLGILKANICYDYIWREIENKRMRNAGLARQAPIGFALDDIYSYHDWKDESAVSWKMRGFILRRIDDAVEKYHKYAWGTNYSDKLQQLLIIIVNLQDHLLKSQSGKRDAAIVALGQQVTRVVDRLKHDAVGLWDARTYYGTAHDEDALIRTYQRAKKAEKAESIGNWF